VVSLGFGRDASEFWAASISLSLAAAGMARAGYSLRAYRAAVDDPPPAGRLKMPVYSVHGFTGKPPLRRGVLHAAALKPTPTSRFRFSLGVC